MIKFFRNLLIFIGFSFLGACATIISGTTQSIYIDTPELTDATCVLRDAQGGSWFLDKTPGYVTVKRGDGPLHVMCKKHGYHDGKAKAGERAKPSVMGNIANGLFIGAFVDLASGAAEEYPDSITILMMPREFTSDEQRRKWFEMQETTKGYSDDGKTLVY